MAPMEGIMAYGSGIMHCRYGKQVGRQGKGTPACGLPKREIVSLLVHDAFAHGMLGNRICYACLKVIGRNICYRAEF